MLTVTRFVASLAISVWGLAMLLIGVVNGVPMWILLGLVVTGVGLPFLAAHPAATGRLYPRRGGIDSAAPGGS
jgi:hypothetical protein